MIKFFLIVIKNIFLNLNNYLHKNIFDHDQKISIDHNHKIIIDLDHDQFDLNQKCF